MRIDYPEYYHQFRCIAAACPDSCCKEWEVDVDAVSAEYYRSLQSPLGDSLRQVLQDTEDGTVMQICDGRCPMWRTDGLCRIQAELGQDALCKTCREFPRLRHDYGDFVELGLELSCPEAARLILSSDGKWCSETCDGGETPDYDRESMAILQSSRDEALRLLADSRYGLFEALAIILYRSHSVQAALDGGAHTKLDPQQCLTGARKYAGQGDMAAIRSFFEGLEILTDQWKRRISQLPEPACHTEKLTAVARYMIQRYWLQAIADYDLVCRVKLVVIACLLIGSLGGDVTRTAQLFSKEIENDPDNIEAILDAAYASQAFTDSNLLSLLLQS